MGKKNVILDSKCGYHIHCYDNMLPEQKAVMICLHGFAGDKNSSVIARVTESLKADGIGTFVLEWPAHGESDADFKQLRVENCIADLQVVIQHVKNHFPGPLYCFATSFGGYLAMYYHVNHPDAFQKIILRSPALNMGDVFLGLKPADIRERLEHGETLDFGFEQPLMVSIDLYHDFKEHDIFHAQVENRNRILVIHGDMDEDVPTADSEDFCARNKIALHIIKGCDHRYKNPGEVEEVIEVVQKFLK